MWKLKAGETVTGEKLAWLKSMKQRVKVIFRETSHKEIGPEGQELRGLNLTIQLREDSPQLRKQLEKMGFHEVFGEENTGLSS